MIIFALLIFVSHAHLSPGEVVRYTHDGVTVDAAWNDAGADFQHSIDDVCSRFEAFDSCASALLDDLLAADLRLWNARDGKNLTWAQRPPRLMPEHLRDRFTRSGTIQQLHSYTDQSQPNCEIHQAYSGDEIDAFIDRVRARAYGPSYPEVDYYIYQLAEAGSLAAFLGSRVVVFGSIRPWYESVAIALGAAYVATVEYAPLQYDYNRNGVRIDTFKPQDQSLHDLKGSFDVAISISSFEHDGLGRYGDSVDPDADIAAMRSMRSFLKPDGLALLAVPVGADTVVWNLHRIYGRIRLPLLIERWSVLASAGFDKVTLEQGKIIVTQPLMLLAPTDLLEGFSWNLPASSCISQLQQLQLCRSDVDDE